MTPLDHPVPPHFEALMVRVVDDAATPAEREELMAWLADKPELRRELDEHRALKAVTDGWVERLALDLAEDRHCKAPATRAETWLGLALFLGGLGLLGGWGLAELLMDETVPAPVQVGTAATVAGAVVLLAAVVRWRMQTRKSDRYEEVIR